MEIQEKRAYLSTVIEPKYILLINKVNNYTPNQPIDQHINNLQELYNLCLEERSILLSIAKEFNYESEININKTFLTSIYENLINNLIIKYEWIFNTAIGYETELQNQYEAIDLLGNDIDRELTVSTFNNIITVKNFLVDLIIVIRQMLQAKVSLRGTLGHSVDDSVDELKYQNEIRELDDDLTELYENYASLSEISRTKFPDLLIPPMKYFEIVTRNEGEDCIVCLENKTEFAKYKCGHMCCLECTKQINMCPLCRLYLFGRTTRTSRRRTSSRHRTARTTRTSRRKNKT
jgi:hypothetical protein